MSAPRSCAARKTLRPMRPKPLMPTRTDTGTPRSFLVEARRLAGGSGPRRCAIHVPVLDLDEVAIVAPELRCEVLGDHHRAVAAAGAADGDHEVRLALEHVLREQVLEQGHDPVVELVQAAVARDVVDDRVSNPVSGRSSGS